MIESERESTNKKRTGGGLCLCIELFKSNVVDNKFQGTQLLFVELYNDLSSK